MKQRLFEYAILVHPETDKDGKGAPGGKTQVLRSPIQVLAKGANGGQN